MSEAVAVFGLVLTVFGLNKCKSIITVAASVALWIVAAYWFTASTSFANPAVTLARSLTPTFAGIPMTPRPSSLRRSPARWPVGTGAVSCFRVPAPAREPGQLGDVSARTV